MSRTRHTSRNTAVAGVASARRSPSLMLALSLAGLLTPSLALAKKPLAKAKTPAAAATAAPAKAADPYAVPDGAAPPKLVFPRPTRYALPSGAKVLVVERHTLPMAEISVIWPVGGTVDPAGLPGLSGLVADLLDEGTQKHGALELAEAEEGLGSSIQSASGWDYTAVTLTTLTKNLDASLALLAEVITTPAFDDKEIERKRAERVTAISQRKDSAAATASDVYSRALYGEAHPFGRSILGTEAGVQKITRADITTWYAARLGPSGATIIVTGDVAPLAVKAKLEKALAAWKSSPPATAPAAAAPAVAPPAKNEPGAVSHFLLVDKPGAPQSEIRIGQPGVPRSSPDYFPLLVMNTILGGDFSSRLNLNLREVHGYTYGAHSDFAFRQIGGPFVIGTAAKTAVTGPTLSESFKELEGMRSAQVKPEELRFAKDQLERAMARRFETIGNIFGELAAQVVYKLPDDYLATFAQKVEAVSAADVERVSKEHLVPEHMSVVVVGDAKTVWPQIWKIGPFQKVDAATKAEAPTLE